MYKKEPRKVCRKIEEISKQTNWKNRETGNTRYIYFLRNMGVPTQKFQYPIYSIFKKIRNYLFLNFTKMCLGINLLKVTMEDHWQNFLSKNVLKINK